MFKTGFRCLSLQHRGSQVSSDKKAERTQLENLRITKICYSSSHCLTVKVSYIYETLPSSSRSLGLLQEQQALDIQLLGIKINVFEDLLAITLFEDLERLKYFNH